VFVGLLPLALAAAYHCDELNVMRHVCLFGQGDFDVPGRPGLLWFLLLPLTWMPSPQSILLAGRLASVAVAGCSAVLLVHIAVRDNGRWGALLAVTLLFLSPTFLAHAYEIRTDTFVLPVQLVLLGLLLRRDRWRHAWWVAGLLVAAILLFSQKSLYFVAALQAVVIVHTLLVGAAGKVRPLVRGLVVTNLIGLALVLAYYALLMALSSDARAFLDENLGAAASTAFTPKPLSGKVEGLARSVMEAPLLYGLCFAGMALALTRPRQHPRLAGLALLDLALLSTIFFHRGFFHYYVAYLEPWHTLMAAVTLGALWKLGRQHRWLHGLVLVAVAGSVVWGGVRYDLYRHVHNGYQRAVMTHVVEAFDDKVQVFDGIGLLPGYPQPGFFMTKGGRDAYRSQYPDDGLIRLWRDPAVQVFVYDYMTRTKYLTRNERRYVHEHYLPYRDNIRLLGYRATAGTDGTAEILVPGPYTAWFHGGWSGDVTVAGTPLAHGQTIELTAGTPPLRFEQVAGAGELWLIIGADRQPDMDVRDWSMFPLLNRHRYQRYKKRGDLKTPPDDPSVVRKKKKKKKK